MPGEIEVFIGDDGTVEVDMRQSGLTATQKRALREELATRMKGKVTGEKHEPVKQKSAIKLKGG